MYATGSCINCHVFGGQYRAFPGNERVLSNPSHHFASRDFPSNGRVLQAALLHETMDQGFRNPIRTTVRKDFGIGLARMNGYGQVGGKSPGSRGPNDETGVCTEFDSTRTPDSKLYVNRRANVVFVFYLSFRQGCSTRNRPIHRFLAPVDQVFLHKLRERPEDGRFVSGIHRPVFSLPITQNA